MSGRSAAWFGAEGRSGMIHRSWMRNQGVTDEVFDGRPVIGIATTWSATAGCRAPRTEPSCCTSRPRPPGGGPLALVETGVEIELDVPGRRLHLHVDDDEPAARRARWRPPAVPDGRGWTRLYTEHVLQADQGADLDFLVGRSGAEVPRESH